MYLRLFSEMNNAANPYSAYDHDGGARGAAHTQVWFRQAWRRVAIVIRGGRVRTVNRRLRRLGLPKLRGRTVKIGEQTITVTGMAKGAAMIGPNMSTMLALIMTDAALSKEDAQAALFETTSSSPTAAGCSR